VLGRTDLNLCLLIGRDDEVVGPQRFPPPLPVEEVQDGTGFGKEVRIPREDPTPFVPGPMG
jgi:hypothetical protein